jgi:hypothetical protein
MKIGDVVTVKDALGYNTYMQELVGHIGVICGDYDGNEVWVQVHILGKTRPIMISDLEAVKKCP